MILTKPIWTIKDKDEFISYLDTKRNESKVAWSKNILNTPSDVLALKTKDMVDIAKEIYKGNYQSFLDLKITNYYETIALYGMLLNRTDEYNTLMTYIIPYIDMMDCWAHCDLIKLPMQDKHMKDYIELSLSLRHDDRVFARRFSLFILFQYVKDKSVLPLIFDSMKDLKEEDAYYVIMMAGWLLSEALILHKEATESFLSSNELNPKIVNKAIQKCRESNRLSKEEKDYLLKYKMKNKK